MGGPQIAVKCAYKFCGRSSVTVLCDGNTVIEEKRRIVNFAHNWGLDSLSCSVKVMPQSVLAVPGSSDSAVPLFYYSMIPWIFGSLQLELW